MRFIIFLLVIIPNLLSSQSQIIKFDTQEIDLGTITKGEQVEGSFTFQNISDDDVEIDLVSTCECTIAEWPAYPIKPGEKGTISFTFDSTKKDKVEPIDIDVFFLNIDPQTGRPLIVFLQYKYTFED